MHRTEGPDHTGNLYKETNPATVINAHAMNALQEEVARAVVESGQTLVATGALDAAAGWVQLREAIRRLPLMQPVDVTIALAVGATNLTPALGQNFIAIDRLGGGVSTIVNFPNNVAYLGRIITILNTASAQIQIKDRRGFLSVMAHHAVEMFYCFIDDDGVNYNWAPMSGEYSGFITTTYEVSDVAASIGPIELMYRKKGYKIDLHLAYYGLGSAFGATNVLTVPLPPFLHGQGNSKPLVTIDDLIAQKPILTYTSFPSGDLAIQGLINNDLELQQQWISYFADNELTA
jgi:hypothetical protein